MKKLILAVLAASVAVSPLAIAPASAAPQNRYVQNQKAYNKAVRKDQRQAYRNWRKGERFDYRQARNYRVINDYRGRHLKAPPRGYHYVQSGNDAVLVAIGTGLIAAVIAGALN